MKLVGERRALATIVFAFFFLQYLMTVLMGPPPELTNVFLSLAGVYGLAFFSLVAGYFWARWYSIGTGLFGVIMGVIGLWQGPEEGYEIYMFFLITHALTVLMLWGDTMSAPYDGQTKWREKWHMDENAVQRLGRAVIRAGVSLPFVLLYAFAPKPQMLLGFAALALTGVGLRALVRMKTWGIFALGAAGGLLVAQSGATVVTSGTTVAVFAPALAGVLLILATTPFVPAMFRYLRGHARTV